MTTHPSAGLLATRHEPVDPLPVKLFEKTGTNCWETEHSNKLPTSKPAGFASPVTCCEAIRQPPLIQAIATGSDSSDAPVGAPGIAACAAPTTAPSSVAMSHSERTFTSTVQSLSLKPLP